VNTPTPNKLKYPKKTSTSLTSGANIMARKSKGFSELLAQQQIGQGVEKSLDNLEKKVKEDFGNNVQLLRDEPGLVKMSEVLEKLVEPYIETTSGKHQIEALLSLGSMAWNMSIIPKKSRQKELEKALKQMMKGQDHEAMEVTRFLVKDLMERKEKLFPDNQRMIMSFDVHPRRSGGYDISVASTIPPNQ
jgi:predicted RNA-binding protein with RPS1 domain